MMVTFISQCEKNALKKSRRVIDAFANRIGDNVWQTVITEEGLKTVKKMLRETASKSTAVSCHWIRSRSRSQFLWVVGNKSKFNDEGYVAVNYTNDEIIIGDIKIMTDQIYANTKGQRLDHHLFGVAYLAYKIMQKLAPAKTNLAQAALIAGCWHDIGKIDPAFQAWLNKKLKNKKQEEIPEEGQHIDKGKFSWEKHPRHNEISLLLFELFFNESNLNTALLNSIVHTIYWHHAKPLRKKDFKNFITVHEKFCDFENNYSLITSSVIAILQSVKNLLTEYLGDDLPDSDSLTIPKFDDIEDHLDTKDLPKYKTYISRGEIERYTKYIKNNATNNLVRAVVITADRLVSKNLTGTSPAEQINSQMLDEIFIEAFQKDRGLNSSIQQCLDSFNSNKPDIIRNTQQATAAKELADEEISIGVLKGPAGCGKTKIALEWALNTQVKKIFWVCPRVQICEGLFIDLSKPDYLPDSRIEICTGEIKKTLLNGVATETPEGEEFSGEIVITTIDQIVNTITTHRNVTTLVAFMDSHVVFDEYHEYINMPAFNLLFAELVECKKFSQNDTESLPNTLLVSATPNPLFLEKLLDIPKQDIIGIPSFNTSRYQINFVHYDENEENSENPFFQLHPPNTFVISNTAITAQKSFIDNQEQENGILLHSKFTKTDRERLFQNAFEAFKENGNKKYQILRSGPVVQAALNITCDNMVSEMTHAENFLQRLGRLDRFGKNKQINPYIIAITDDVKTGKSKGASSRFLHQLKTLQSTKAWYGFLQNALPQNAPLAINHIYKIYEQFYQDELSRKSIESDLLDALKESVVVIDFNLVDPVSIPSKKKEESTIKIKKHSLRGDSRFVQMAMIDLSNRNQPPDQKNCYLEDVMTYDINQIEGTFRGQKNSDRDLLSFMFKKDHKIRSIKEKKAIRQKYSLNILKNEARDPSNPIYVSYTQDDLDLCNDSPNPYAIYYAIGTRQPIGAISLNQLETKGE